MKKSIHSHNDDTDSRYENYLESIVDTIRESLLVLDKNLRVISANKTFYLQFQVSPKQTEKVLIYELGNGQWNIPQLRKLLEEILPTHNPFNNFKVEHVFPKIGKKVMLLNARQIKAKGSWKDRILLAIEDITQYDRDRKDKEAGIEREREVSEELRKSEVKFNTLSTLAPVGIFMTDKDGNCLYVNEKWQQIAGMSQETALGKGWTKALHPEDKERVFLEWYSFTSKKNREFRSVYRFKSKNGKTTWVEGKAVAINGNGEVSGYIGSVVDINDIKETSEALRSQSQLLQAITENATLGLFMMDSKGRTTYMNPAAERMTGYSFSELEDKVLHDKIHNKRVNGEKFPISECPIARTVLQSHERLNNHEDVFIRKNGKFFPVLCASSPLLDNGEITGVVLEVIDITERKELERQKDDFLGIASHELKTPVTSLKAFGQVIQSRLAKLGDENSVNLLSKMDAQINKLTNLIQDLLDISKIEGGRLQFHEEKFVFDELVEELIEEIQRTTETHKLVKIGDTKKKIYGDRERIGQVITNFLTNAIKYSPHGKKILIKTIANSQNIELCVQDFGVGIDKKNIPHVFERFYRVKERATNYTVPGMGLGLYISSEIIRRQGGRIWAESKKGKGSTFCFSLPLKNRKVIQEKNTLVREEMKHD